MGSHFNCPAIVLRRKAGPQPDAQPLYRCYSKTEKSCRKKENCIDLSLKHLTADVTHTGLLCAWLLPSSKAVHSDPKLCQYMQVFFVSASHGIFLPTLYT